MRERTMTRPVPAFWALMIGVTCMPAFARGAAEGGAAPTEEAPIPKLYFVQYVEANEALLLARQECFSVPLTPCRDEMRGRNVFEFITTPAMHQQIAAVLEKRDVPPPTQEFQVLLLVAGDQPAASGTIPANAARVLDDLKGFLPYRSYQLMDTGFVRTTEHGEVALGASPGYFAEIHFRGDPASGKGLFVEGFRLSRNETIMKDSGVPEMIRRPVLSTSFGIQPGETVVVGTSKLDGGSQALVVLVTAVPSAGAGRRAG